MKIFNIIATVLFVGLCGAIIIFDITDIVHENVMKDKCFQKQGAIYYKRIPYDITNKSDLCIKDGKIIQ